MNTTLNGDSSIKDLRKAANADAAAAFAFAAAAFAFAAAAAAAYAAAANAAERDYQTEIFREIFK